MTKAIWQEQVMRKHDNQHEPNVAPSSNYLLVTNDCIMHLECWRSYKVIAFCTNQKPIYDFLLVINCHLCSARHFYSLELELQGFEHVTSSLQSSDTNHANPLHFVSEIQSCKVQNQAKHPTLAWAPDQGDPFEFRRPTYHTKTWGTPLHCMKTALYYPQLFCHNTRMLQTNDDDDRQHIMTIAKLHSFWMFTLLRVRNKW